MAMENLPELLRRVRHEYERVLESNERTFQKLPSEVEEGNVEYKLQLLDPSPDRLKQLVTQLHWRLNEGKGVAFYEVGVRDNGVAIGINEQSMVKSLTTLSRMCQVLQADLEVVHFRDGHALHHKAVRVRITRIAQKKAKKQLRVSVIGDVESGKSTLIGVLTRGCLDDGSGLARMQVFRHRHEIENGRTSSISEHPIGITQDGRFALIDDFGDFDQLDDDDESKEIRSVITLSDLAGHKKYLKVTASGLASQFPDYTLLVVDSTKGVQAMTIEHVKIAAALELSLFVVVTKVDIATADRVHQTTKEVAELFQSFCSEKRLLVIGEGDELPVDDTLIPLFQVSNVDGCGLNELQKYLATLEPKRTWIDQLSVAAEFQINKCYDIEEIGTVVTGLMQSGTICVGEHMLLGPDSNGQFVLVEVDSIEVQRKATRSLGAGQTGAILLNFPDDVDVNVSSIRKGMMLVHPSVRPMATLQFDAEVHFLKDSPTIRENYQAVIHAGQIRQMAKLVRMDSFEEKETEQRAMCRFEFMYWPEYIRPDLPLVLREGMAHAVGKIGAVMVSSEQDARASDGVKLTGAAISDNASASHDLQLQFNNVHGHVNAKGSNNDGGEDSVQQVSTKKVKIKKKKGPRAQTIEEVFATISTVRSSGLNPPAEHIVLTPRSAEACLRCGVNPETLKIRDLDSFYDPEITPAVQRMRHEAYSMRRHEEMKAVRAEKKKIVAAEEEDSPKSLSPSPKKKNASAHSTPEKNDASSMLEIERKRLEKVRLRQERELEQMLEFEMKMSKIQQDANEKLERERRLHEQRERERVKRQQELAEEKRMREIKKKAQMDVEEERRKVLAAEMAARDRELAEQKAKQERLRRIEARQREEERKAKAEEHRLVTEAIIKQQQFEINERLKELEHAELTRNEMLEQQRLLRAQEMEDRRRKVALRIRKNLKMSRKIELQRKKEIKRKQKASDQLRKEHEEELERQRELARQQQEMLERKRQMVLDEARREEERKKEELLQRQREIDMNVQQVQQTQAHQLEMKKEYRRIQQQLKLDKVERMKRIQEYKRLETLRKLHETEERTQQMLQEKDELVRRRKQIAVQTKIQRDMIIRTMENVKITKKWNQAHKTIEKVMGKSPGHSPSPTKSVNRPKSSSSVTRSATMLPTITRPTTPGNSGSGNQSRVFRPPSPPPVRTAFKFTKEAEESASSTTKGGKPQAYFSPYEEVPDQIRMKKNKNMRSAVF
ncbi:TPA: hypothetical protein N0F65_007466 [Lagenidium giganteum]|uniref:Elongation factor Tu, chloroplastic n=1 Tax=Lagenidium giganteum TaxID=4803 RepID=A0AAV2ZIP0_9STRA|nr:TPA: hypothetical protein N0F65_007466 [Lagenidium giganteum]